MALPKKREIPVFRLDFEKLAKYEIVLLLARRARQINQKRVELESRLNMRMIERTKPINQAIEELLSGVLTYDREEREEDKSKPLTKGPKTIL